MANKNISLIPQDHEYEIDISRKDEVESDWESEHPIFMTKIPNNLNDGLLALQNIKYSGKTPLEVAEQLKEEGNEYFKRQVC